MGTFFEGETILIIGGLTAHLGYLQLPMVMVVAFIGSFSGDQVYFFAGRSHGRKLIARHPEWCNRVEKIHAIIERYHDLIMLGFRFVYGIRILTPIVIGMNQRIRARRFIILNAIGAVIWAAVVSAGGYLFGAAPIFWMFHRLRERSKTRCR